MAVGMLPGGAAHGLPRDVHAVPRATPHLAKEFLAPGVMRLYRAVRYFLMLGDKGVVSSPERSNSGALSSLYDAGGPVTFRAAPFESMSSCAVRASSE